jgi:hypothetical protein
MANERVLKALGERFSFTVTNNTGAKKVIAILAAMFDTLVIAGTANTTTGALTLTKAYTDPAAIVAAGYACDHVLDDGTIITDLVAASGNSEMTIRQFREFIKTGGGKVLVDMSVQANNGAAFNETIKVIKVTPLGGSKPEYLPLGDFKSVDQSATDKIEVKGVELEMAYDTLMLLPVATGHSVTISFRFS